MSTPIARARLQHVLAEVDPMGLIALGAPDDEYAPEADAILALPVLDAAGVRAVFVEWFSLVPPHPDSFWHAIARACRVAVRA
jgi:hypothetical protein